MSNTDPSQFHQQPNMVQSLIIQQVGTTGQETTITGTSSQQQGQFNILEKLHQQQIYDDQSEYPCRNPPIEFPHTFNSQTILSSFLLPIIQPDDTQVQQLQYKVTTLTTEVEEKDSHIEELNEKIEDLKRQIKKLKAENTIKNDEIAYHQKIIAEMENVLSQLDVKGMYLKMKQLSIDIENKNQALQTLELEIQEQDKQNQINQLRLMSTKDQRVKLQAEFDYAKDEILRIKKQSNIKINQKDFQISSLNSDIRVLNQQLKDAETSIENLKQQLETEQNANKALEAELNKPQIDRSHITRIQEAQEKLRNQMREQQRLQDESNAQKIEDLRKESEKILQKLQEQKRQDQIGRNKRNQEQLANQMGKAAQNQGVLDVCYIIDSTLSMEPYIQQTRNCIKQSSQLIKKLTNRDTNWSAICYYDIEEKPANGLYLQHDFTKNMEDIEKFLYGIKTVGGSDPPEDVKGAVQQMLVNLKWSARFKIALLITDSPCHGKKYHNVRDNHPNDDMDETIIQLIDQNIILIGLNLTKYSNQMYQVIGKLFEAKQKKDNFYFVEMNGAAMETIGAKMAKCIGDASENAIGINNNSTKSKRMQQARLEAKDGAMEELCKYGNFYDFEKQADVECVQTKLKVLKVEITQEAFDKNLLDINNIGTLNSDYRVTEEGQWDCIRTDKPFAFGMMKDVFLMKKNGAPDELYVIKTPIGSEPYKTQAEAIAECRSHLLCQQLMNKFQKDIEEAIQAKRVFKQYPKVVYSSFLILKETDTKYWIAERFFKGEFVKYNNNFGFMNDSEDELNKFAQAFSLYTLYISGSNYIINNVQGVENYFTDPAVNTLSGNFDDTDMGEDGIGMFLVNYQSKRHLTKEIEELLDIEF